MTGTALTDRQSFPPADSHSAHQAISYSPRNPKRCNDWRTANCQQDAVAHLESPSLPPDGLTDYNHDEPESVQQVYRTRFLPGTVLKRIRSAHSAMAIRGEGHRTLYWLTHHHEFSFCASVHHSTSQMKHQLDATLCRFYFCRVTLHVPGVKRPSSGVFKTSTAARRCDDLPATITHVPVAAVLVLKLLMMGACARNM